MDIGGARPSSSPKHDTLAVEELTLATLREYLVSPRYTTPQARERVDLSSFFIVNFFARTCLSRSLLISLSLLGLRVGSSLFGSYS